MEAVHEFTPTGLALKLGQATRQAQQRGRAIVVSISEPIAPFDAINLFARAAALSAERFLWSKPDADFALVGVGTARVLSATDHTRFQQIAHAWHQLLLGALRDNPAHVPGVGPVLMGGFAFDVQRPTTPLWSGFPAAQLVLPQLLLTRHHAEHWLTFNVLVGADTNPEVEQEALYALRDRLLGPEPLNLRKNGAAGNGHNGNGQRTRPTPHIAQHELRPAAVWQKDVARAARAIREAQLEKVVLARAVQLHAARPFEAAPALRHLSERYTGCYIFAVARGERCFLGATPERLLRLQHGEVHTMSLAGSIRRGKTPDEDHRLGQTLLNSAKDRYEHAVVVQTLVEALNETCTNVHVDQIPHLLKLGNIQHLCTPITGQLLGGYSLLDLVELLHPTPAVGGRPREAALRLIRDCEQLDRGWYASPVGWLDAQGEGEFAVALRSALLYGQQATLFAGCGIVGDSDPAHEYAESRLKLKPMLAALTEHF